MRSWVETEVTVAEKLSGGDRRSSGRVPEIVADVLKNPLQFAELIAAMSHDDPIVRMRAADAVEKITVHHPEYLFPHKRHLLHTVAKINQQEVRWHIAQILPRLSLDRQERADAIPMLFDYLNDPSSIVKTFALEGLAALSKDEPMARAKVVSLLKNALQTGTPAMKSRSRNLLAKLQEK
ncbi:MAG TPA: hypothetical protein VGA99_12015 [bacterium]